MSGRLGADKRSNLHYSGAAAYKDPEKCISCEDLGSYEIGASLFTYRQNLHRILENHIKCLISRLDYGGAPTGHGHRHARNDDA